MAILQWSISWVSVSVYLFVWHLVCDRWYKFRHVSCCVNGIYASLNSSLSSLSSFLFSEFPAPSTLYCYILVKEWTDFCLQMLWHIAWYVLGVLCCIQFISSLSCSGSPMHSGFDASQNFMHASFLRCLTLVIQSLFRLVSCLFIFYNSQVSYCLTSLCFHAWKFAEIIQYTYKWSQELFSFLFLSCHICQCLQLAEVLSTLIFNTILLKKWI